MTIFARILAVGLLCTLFLGSGALGQTQGWTAWSAPTSQGKEFHSKSLLGKVVVISVWASWCPSCRRQIPQLSQLQRAHERDDFQVVSFSLDKDEETHDGFLENLDVSFPAIYARSGRGLTAVKILQEQTGALEAVPTLLVFDRQGNLVHRSVGYANFSKLESLVEPLLQGSSANSR